MIAVIGVDPGTKHQGVACKIQDGPLVWCARINPSLSKKPGLLATIDESNAFLEYVLKRIPKGTTKVIFNIELQGVRIKGGGKCAAREFFITTLTLAKSGVRQTSVRDIKCKHRKMCKHRASKGAYPKCTNECFVPYEDFFHVFDPDIELCEFTGDFTGEHISGIRKNNLTGSVAGGSHQSHKKNAIKWMQENYPITGVSKLDDIADAIAYTLL